MEPLPRLDDRSSGFAHPVPAIGNDTKSDLSSANKSRTMESHPISHEPNPGADMIENGERRPQVPTWSVANSKESQSALQPDHVTGLDVQKPETRLDLDNSNGSNAASADADAISDIDELLTGGDAEPEPPRYDGDFDIERHDYWWNLLDMENPRHSRASKGMRYGQERNPRCDTCERQNRACMTRPNSHDKTGCVRCSYTQSGCSHAREARESHQQRTGFPLLKAGGARKRDELDDDDSRSPPAEGVTNKRPRLSSYSTGFPEGRGSNATPSRPAFDAPSVNGRHISPLHVTGSIPERERTGANGGSVRSNRHDAQYYDSHTEVTRHEDRYQQSDRYEISARDLNNVLDLVQKLQREVRTLRSRLDGMETRVDNISGAVDI